MSESLGQCQHKVFGLEKDRKIRRGVQEVMAECMAFASAVAALKCMNGWGWRGIPDIQAIDGLMKGKGV